MLNFKQFLLEYNIDTFEMYFKKFKNENEEPLDELTKKLRIERNPSDEQTWMKIKEELEKTFTEAEKEFDNWAGDGSWAHYWVIQIADVSFDTMLEKYFEENLIDDMIYLDVQMDKKFFNKVFESQQDAYYVYEGFGSHGFIFDDGTTIDIPSDDHRIIPIEKWVPNNIITLHLSNNILTVRLNTSSNSKQFDVLDNLIQDSDYNIKEVYYDVYDDNNIMIKHGKFSVHDEYDWYDIRTKDNNKSQLKQYR